MTSPTIPRGFRLGGFPAGLTRRLRRVAAILVTAVREFFRLRALEAGAGIAFYALFSLFPLLILLVSLLGFIFEREQVQSEVLAFLEKIIPFSQEEILQLAQENLRVIIEQRGSVSILAALGLVWAGTSVFNSMVRNINLAWRTTAAPMKFLKSRLMALTIIGILAAFILVSIITTTVLNLLSRLDLPISGGASIEETTVWLYLTKLLPYAFNFLFFLGLYRWVPNTKVRWSETAWGSLVATIAWHLAIAAYTWYIQEGLLKYQLVYGSLATVVITMFWIFISSLILLFGAHLGAAIARHRQDSPAFPRSAGS